MGGWGWGVDWFGVIVCVWCVCVGGWVGGWVGVLMPFQFVGQDSDDENV
jgi:hypothetical protein